MSKNSNDRSMAFRVEVETVAEDGDADSGNKNADGEDENMESLLFSFGDDGEDGDFMTSEEKEAAAALERRRKRKRRLQSLEASADSTTNKDKNINANLAKRRKEIEITKQTSEIKSGNLLKGENTTMDEDKKDAETDGDDSSDDFDFDSDDSDMFGSPSSEEKARKKEKKKRRKKVNNSEGQNESKRNDNKEASRQDGFDDNDGYYKASIGETMELEVLGGGSRIQSDNESEAWTLKLRVLGIIGKGVFSSVLKCSTTTIDSSCDDGIPSTISLPGGNGLNANNEHQQHGLPSKVAIKCIRSNETMAKAALDEMKFLIRLRDSPGIVPLLLPSPQNGNSDKTNPNYVPPPIDFRGHTLLVFPYLPYNLRDVLQKFGKGVGLSLGAVKNYFRQLLSAAIHLQKKGVIHADIKPDNILVSPDFSRVVVADFGSAFESRIVYNDDDEEGSSAVAVSSPQSNQNEAVTPYLVSRFYRAPEIILGLQPLTYAIDLWSFAVTAGELFLGKVVLPGANNNDMLYSMMKLLGPFSARTIKCHLLQTKKHPLQAHFAQIQSNFVFKQESIDPVLGKPVHKEISLANSGNNNNHVFRATLQTKLLRAKSPKDTRTEILFFADLLTKCLVLDPSKRISVKSTLKHKFFAQQQQQNEGSK